MERLNHTRLILLTIMKTVIFNSQEKS